VNLEEELEDLAKADARGIEDDLDGFGVCTVMAVGGAGHVAACVAHPRRQNAVLSAKEVLHTPEATAGKNSAFRCHDTSSRWFR
jgi:hypothetical protein